VEGKVLSLITVIKMKKLCFKHNHSLEDIDVFKWLKAFIQATTTKVLKNYQYYKVATAIKAPNISEIKQ
jgi:hypothetical protein